MGIYCIKNCLKSPQSEPLEGNLRKTEPSYVFIGILKLFHPFCRRLNYNQKPNKSLRTLRSLR